MDGGGFELLRVPEGGGKQLDVIASPESGYSVLSQSCCASCKDIHKALAKRSELRATKG